MATERVMSIRLNVFNTCVCVCVCEKKTQAWSADAGATQAETEQYKQHHPGSLLHKQSQRLKPTAQLTTLLRGTMREASTINTASICFFFGQNTQLSPPLPDLLTNSRGHPSLFLK